MKPMIDDLEFNDKVTAADVLLWLYLTIGVGTIIGTLVTLFVLQY